MSLKTFKPYTKSTRTTILVDRKGLWKGRPLKSLTAGKISSGGRNNLGRITSRAKGSGHKKRYRMIDFHRNKFDMKAKVAEEEIAVLMQKVGEITRKINEDVVTKQKGIMSNLFKKETDVMDKIKMEQAKLMESLAKKRA